MPTFSYRGRNAGGQVITGVLDAGSASAVADFMHAQQLIPVQIGEADFAGSRAASAAGVSREKVSLIDLLLFSRQMHTLLRSGVSIMRSLNGLQDAASNEAMKKVIGELRESLEGGRQLSQALARHPRVFSLFYLAMVRVGESTGRLDEIFLRLFRHLEFERYMRDQVKSALRYPFFVIIAMAIALVVVSVFVIPQFAKVFANFGAELPLLTRLLLGFSRFMTDYWPALLALAFAAFIGFRAWLATSGGRFIWDGLALKIPIAGKIVRKAALSRFARSFALAARSGVPLMQALSNSAQTVDNGFLEQRIERLRDQVERGESLLSAAVSSRVFTPVVLQMLAVGEQSGNIDEMMDEVGDMYRQEVEYDLKTLGQQIEPILIMALGVIVAILALGIFLPMWDLGRVAIKH